MTRIVPIRAARSRLRAGSESVRICGRIEVASGDARVSDASASAPLDKLPKGIGDGDLVSGLLRCDGAVQYLDDVEILARGGGEVDRALARRLPLLARRAAIVAAIRGYFAEQGFLEVDTPCRVVCPGLEPHLVAIPAGAGRFLATSPELHLKRLLAAGSPPIFEIAHAFRDEENGPWHLTEFAMLEWYRPHGSLDELMDDVVALLRRAARAAGVRPQLGGGCDLALPAEKLTVREAFERHAGIDLAAHRGRDGLARAVEEAGIAVDARDGWDDLFHRLFLERVEPRLGRERITFLSEYPASLAALARVRDDDEWPVALRFEAFAGGLELANAFDELTDPVEQRRRHEADRVERARQGREVPPLDERFLAALEAGHPPAVGIALGLDRLVALILSRPSLDDVVAFPRD